MTQAEFDEFEAANVHGAGHCNELGTASTIAALVEALGMSLPGTAAIPANDRGRVRHRGGDGCAGGRAGARRAAAAADRHRRGARQRDHGC